MSDTPDASHSEHIKRFVFTEKSEKEDRVSVEVVIPEKLQASYSFYTWPCAPYLAWYLFEHRTELEGKHILELGAGTSLPSILAAKCGAKVTITDSILLQKTLQHIHHICQTNQLNPDCYQVVGITWGFFTSQIFELDDIDLIIASDCFYEPHLFEDILMTVAYLLNRNPQAIFLCTYQERSADYTIEHLLNNWSLTCRHLDISCLGTNSEIDLTMSAANKLFVANLPWTVGTVELRRYFLKYGSLAVCEVKFDWKTGLSKGYGFVSFKEEKDMKACMENKNHTLEGVPIVVRPAVM
ncbi:hypothetical protein RUM44_010962 [Polyplax serrata]|uniref:RRM domain-containing protein n=1 Tax=Polyplax serrata TaxID=468196 RepID=A0ABR1AP08_POLSC